jgi:hypothetical protein
LCGGGPSPGNEGEKEEDIRVLRKERMCSIISGGANISLDDAEVVVFGKPYTLHE